MRAAIILGAGQMGQAIYHLINHTTYTIKAFGDNNQNLAEREIRGIPILPVKQALLLKPEVVFIGVAGKERGEALEKQARELGYQGKMIRLDEEMKKWDIRSAAVQKMAAEIEQADINGAIAELGVYQGEFAQQVNRLFPRRKLYLFDTFEGFDARDVVTEQQRDFSLAGTGDFSDTDVEMVMAKLKHPENAIICKGYFPHTAEDIEDQFAFVSLDADLYEPTLSGLLWFIPRMVKGGVILLHDYHNKRFSGVRRAVWDYQQQTQQTLMLIPLGDVHGSVWVIPNH